MFQTSGLAEADANGARKVRSTYTGIFRALTDTIATGDSRSGNTTEPATSSKGANTTEDSEPAGSNPSNEQDYSRSSNTIIRAITTVLSSFIKRYGNDLFPQYLHMIRGTCSIFTE